MTKETTRRLPIPKKTVLVPDRSYMNVQTPNLPRAAVSLPTTPWDDPADVGEGE